MRTRDIQGIPDISSDRLSISLKGLLFDKIAMPVLTSCGIRYISGKQRVIIIKLRLNYY